MIMLMMIMLTMLMMLMMELMMMIILSLHSIRNLQAIQNLSNTVRDKDFPNRIIFVPKTCVHYNKCIVVPNTTADHKTKAICFSIYKIDHYATKCYAQKTKFMQHLFSFFPHVLINIWVYVCVCVCL